MTLMNAPAEVDPDSTRRRQIAAVQLDAGWMMLTGCNTGASRATSAEAILGVAWAFIYAQRLGYHRISSSLRRCSSAPDARVPLRRRGTHWQGRVALLVPFLG